MHTIDVDFDVFKELTLRRPSEDVSANDVLRQVLALPPKRAGLVTKTGPSPGDWVSKGVRFPVGTEFRATYKGRTYLGRVEGGALVVDGKRYDSPSPAAIKITGTPVNGWTFWECRLPHHANWQSLKSLRDAQAE
jgi:hypothetical protein